MYLNFQAMFTGAAVHERLCRLMSNENNVCWCVKGSASVAGTCDSYINSSRSVIFLNCVRYIHSS